MIKSSREIHSQTVDVIITEKGKVNFGDNKTWNGIRKLNKDQGEGGYTKCS